MLWSFVWRPPAAVMCVKPIILFCSLVALGISSVESVPSLRSEADVTKGTIGEQTAGINPEGDDFIDSLNLPRIDGKDFKDLDDFVRNLEADGLSGNDEEESLRNVRETEMNTYGQTSTYDSSEQPQYNEPEPVYNEPASYSKEPTYSKPETPSKNYTPKKKVKKNKKKKQPYSETPVKYETEKSYGSDAEEYPPSEVVSYDKEYTDNKAAVDSLNKKYKALVDALHRLDRFYRPCTPSGVEKSGLCLAWEQCTKVVAHDDPCLYDISVKCSKYRPACIVESTLTCQVVKCPTACVEVESMRCDEVCIGGPNKQTFKLTCPPTPYCLPPPKTRQICPLLEPAQGKKVYSEAFKAPVKNYPAPAPVAGYESDNSYPGSGSYDKEYKVEKEEYPEKKEDYKEEKEEYSDDKSY